MFCNFCAFLKSMILYWKFLYVSDFEVKKKQNASDFKLKKIQRVRFWNKIFSFCQIFIKNFNNVSDFSFKFLYS